MKILITNEELKNKSSRELIPLECEVCHNTFFQTKNTVLRGLKGTRKVIACSRLCRNKTISNRLKTYYYVPFKNKMSRYNRLKHELVEMLGGKCQVCGYNKSMSSLTFHHKNPNLKSFSISKVLGRSRTREEIINEVNKCVLLCSNCHWEIHDGLIAI